MRIDKKLIILIVFFYSFFLKIKDVLALEVNYPDILGHSITNTSNFAEYACYLIGLTMDLATLVAAITIAYGAIYYLISYGRGKFTSEARDIIKSGLLGLLIIICATLIAHTINPNLTKCKFGVLSFLGITPLNSTTNPFNAPTVTYKEIPLGVLTETLLTRTMGCYGFDEEGNPIDGEEIITDDKKKGAGPTYLDHDRADCLLQLVEGADRKAQVVAALSAKITELTNQCDCEKYGDCKPKCNPITGCQVDSSCPSLGAGKCKGECINGPCLATPTIPDCCPSGVKEKIEHGPVPVKVDVGSSTAGGKCETQEKQFKGLDEFRCLAGTQCSGIADLIEKEVTVKEEKIKLVDQKEWKKLNLTQQLIYFKEKIDDLKEKIQTDQGVLTQAKNMLQGPKCYLAVPSVDFFRIHTTTNQRDEFILKDKVFSDPETTQKVSAAKYCSGFNYNNSGCFKKCNDECPDTSEEALKAYSKVKDCTGKPYGSSCWSEQKSDIKDAFSERPCTLGDNTAQTYDGCISSCQNSCSGDCAEKYLLCSNDYKICEDRCNNNSKCILDNANECFLNGQAFITCTKDTSDPANTDNCINTAYSCKNGSDQYAGYPDCVNSKLNSSSAKCSLDKYSSSYLYENNECQKCPNPLAPAPAGSLCATLGDKDNAQNNQDSSTQNNKGLCQSVCPETSKCPTASTCPNCPCDEIDQSIKFSIPIQSDKNIEKSTRANGGQNNITTSRETKAYQIVGPECNEYSHNDDPLTFYCQDEWWKNPNREGLNEIPIGTQRMCLPGGEVPVGQTIDGAQNWANGLIDSADKMKQNIENILIQMYKAGKAIDTTPVKEYCKCDAKFENSEPICKTDCIFNQEWIDESIDGDGNIIPGHWVCGCALEACKGNPCDQIIDYLSQIWNSYRQFKLEFIDFYMVMTIEPRSDIMKELTYSRKQANQCSVVRNNFGTESRLMSCTRVEAEVISPIIDGHIIYSGEEINSYCYGENLNNSLTDNWFCCQTYSPNTENSVPIDLNILP